MSTFRRRLASAREGGGKGLLGTWVKLPSFETLQLIGHAGFEFVVIDMEHAPHSLQRAVELVFCAQAMDMGALVRLADDSGATVQPLLDGGADGLLVPRVTSPDRAAAIARRMVFAPDGERGLGMTSRAGRWGLGPMKDYVARGRDIARIIQLEDWKSIEKAQSFASLPDVNGLFIGHGDLLLSSGKPASDPAVRQLTAGMLDVTKRAQILSGVAVAEPEAAREHLAQGFSLVMLSNDTTIFGRAAAEAAAAVLSDR
ncbi:HpcH/HpaI aldolase family protein [Aurantiacibacter poecillastricola]|uniref:HpcH/HpaI aldolase family protein n=1 Tax=Aurantiacibacter poecillastricola TaxID=3064385 RepID=UPI00273D5FFB|nr:aldolase/citrate lyase family protein [Aurantiacibacter sp. 219JJ12-13]MDP5259975.1 aldolase/citrate lyase family protein [Aurantiacibacter sp. 219JJ12-13]